MNNDSRKSGIDKVRERSCGLITDLERVIAVLYFLVYLGMELNAETQYTMTKIVELDN